MQPVGKAIKRSFLYRLIRESRTFAGWTPRDQQILEFYGRFLTAGDLCFDVGANIGNRVKVLLKLPARVVAIEPQAECVRILRAAFGRNRNLEAVVPKALGAEEGQAEIMVSDTSVISSLSPEWVEAVRQSGRFGRQTWERKRIVPVTTLDKLIEQYGRPAFIKIDVEGFEYQVIRGLSQPVKMISLEFTPEFLDATFQSIEHLQDLGGIRLNYSLGETMEWALEKWVSAGEMMRILEGLRNNAGVFGDVYVKFN